MTRKPSRVRSVMIQGKDDDESDAAAYSGPATALTGLPRAIRRHQLRLIAPLVDSTSYEMEQRGEFPRRSSLSPRCVVWDREGVEAWLVEHRRTSPQCQHAPPTEFDAGWVVNRLGSVGMTPRLRNAATSAVRLLVCSLGDRTTIRRLRHLQLAAQRAARYRWFARASPLIVGAVRLFY